MVTAKVELSTRQLVTRMGLAAAAGFAATWTVLLLVDRFW